MDFWQSHQVSAVESKALRILAYRPFRLRGEWRLARCHSNPPGTSPFLTASALVVLKIYISGYEQRQCKICNKLNQE